MNSNSNNSNPLQLSDVEVEYFCNTWYSFFFNQNVDPNPVNVQNIVLNVAALAHNYYSPIIMMHVNNNQQLAVDVTNSLVTSWPWFTTSRHRSRYYVYIYMCVYLLQINWSLHIHTHTYTTNISQWQSTISNTISTARSNTWQCKRSLRRKIF